MNVITSNEKRVIARERMFAHNKTYNVTAPRAPVRSLLAAVQHDCDRAEEADKNDGAGDDDVVHVPAFNDGAAARVTQAAGEKDGTEQHTCQPAT
jgi:hypothetical protein